MGIVNWLFKDRIEKLALKTVKVVNPSLPMFMNGLPIYGTDNAKNNVDAYITSDDIYSIVRRIAKTAAMIPLNVYKVKDENALKEYDYQSKQHNYTTQSLLKKQLLKFKALEMVNESHPLQMILDNPNPLYSKTEFREGAFIFRLSTGNTYIHTPILELGVNAGKPAEMWLVPTPYIRPVVANTYPRYIESYEFNLFEIKQLEREEVIHIRYFNPCYSTSGSELIGLSPLAAGAKVRARQRAETDYTVSSFQNSGISGIVSREDFEDANDPAFKNMKTDFYNEGSGTSNARKNLFTAGKWVYTEVGKGPVDMNVIESAKMTFKKLCNIYGVDDRLFNNDSTGSEHSVIEMIKQMYTNAALPEVYALRDALNMSLTPKYNDKSEKYYIDLDITGISELQDNMKDMATIFSTLPIMIPNLIMEAFNYGKSTDPNMDKVFVKTGYTDLESLLSVMDLPVATPKGN